MAFLKDLTVKKVSFVRRAANRTKFLLLKSADADPEQKDQPELKTEPETAVKTELNKGGNQPVRPELKSRLMSIMKEAALLKEKRTGEQVVALMKADETLKITDAEVTEVQNALELMDVARSAEPTTNPQPTATPAPSPTVGSASADAATAMAAMQQTISTLTEQNKTLNSRLNKSDEDAHKREVMSMIRRDCPNAPGKIEDLADRYIRIEKADAEAAKDFLNSLRGTSVAVENSQIFREIGTAASSPELRGLETEILRDVQATNETLRKSGEGNKVKQSDVIIDSLRKAEAANPGAWDGYLKERRGHGHRDMSSYQPVGN